MRKKETHLKEKEEVGHEERTEEKEEEQEEEEKDDEYRHSRSKF